MGRNECGSNAMVTVQMTVEEYLEMKSRQETKEVTTKQKNLVYGLEGIKTLSVMPDLIGHPSLTELLDELLRLRILLVIHPHHLLFRLCDTLYRDLSLTALLRIDA